MVDNVAITAGTGTTIAADDIGGGVLAQRVKPVWGPDGTGNDVDVASGKSFPVQLRSATGLIPIGEPTDAANSATNTTSVSGISIWKQISLSIQAAAASLVSVATNSGNPLPNGTNTIGTALVAPAATETAATGVTIGASGVGYVGWLSSIAKLLTNALTVVLSPTTAGGLTSISTIIATANGVLSVKASAGSIKKLEVSNTSATAAWLKLYDSASTPTAGSGTPKRRILIPGNASGVLVISSADYGMDFATGIAYCLTGLIADADTTAVTANVLCVNIDYK